MNGYKDFTESLQIFFDFTTENQHKGEFFSTRVIFAVTQVFDVSSIYIKLIQKPGSPQNSNSVHLLFIKSYFHSVWMSQNLYKRFYRIFTESLQTGLGLFKDI